MKSQEFSPEQQHAVDQILIGMNFKQRYTDFCIRSALAETELFSSDELWPDAIDIDELRDRYMGGIPADTTVIPVDAPFLLGYWTKHPR